MGHGTTNTGNTRSRSWCFTWNNYNEEDISRLDSLKCERIVVGEEVGASGTPHLQGYVRFNEAQRFSWWKNQFPHVHVEVRKGTEEEATTYCKKDNKVVIDRGVDILEPKRGVKRTRDDEALEVMQEVEGGRKYGEIRRAHPLFAFWYRRHIAEYISDEHNLKSNPDYVPRTGYSSFS